MRRNERVSSLGCLSEIILILPHGLVKDLKRLLLLWFYKEMACNCFILLISQREKAHLIVYFLGVFFFLKFHLPSGRDGADRVIKEINYKCK